MNNKLLPSVIQFCIWFNVHSRSRVPNQLSSEWIGAGVPSEARWGGQWNLHLRSQYNMWFTIKEVQRITKKTCDVMSHLRSAQGGQHERSWDDYCTGGFSGVLDVWKLSRAQYLRDSAPAHGNKSMLSFMVFASKIMFELVPAGDVQTLMFPMYHQVS